MKKGGALRIPEKKSKIGKVYRRTDGHQWNNEISLRLLLCGIAIYKTKIFISRLYGSSLHHFDINNTCICLCGQISEYKFQNGMFMRIEPLSIHNNLQWNNDPLLVDISNIDSINN